MMVGEGAAAAGGKAHTFPCSHPLPLTRAARERPQSFFHDDAPRAPQRMGISSLVYVLKRLERFP